MQERTIYDSSKINRSGLFVSGKTKQQAIAACYASHSANMHRKIRTADHSCNANNYVSLNRSDNTAGYSGDANQFVILLKQHRTICDDCIL